MVKIKSHQGAVSVELWGSTLDATADFGTAIACVYSRLRNANPDSAEEFRQALCCMLEPDSPVWHYDLPIDPDAVTVIIPVKKEKIRRNPK